MGSHFVEFLRELIVEVQPQQASELVCVILTGISEGLAGSRVLVGVSPIERRQHKY